MLKYSFGFLSYKGIYKFVGGQITPDDDFDDAKTWIAKHAHKDGFLYPPLSWQQTEDGKPVANTERPQHLHRVPASHELCFDDDKVIDERYRPDASFIIHLLGYLHETLLQFEDWWFDVRVSLGNHSLSPVKATNEHFLSHAYGLWQKWPERVRIRFANVLFMLNRAPSYEWDWEHFTIEYMVFDALYRTAVDLKLLTNNKNHKRRLRDLCNAFNIPKDEKLFDEFVQLRNDLFHETLWNNGQPGTGASGESFLSQFHLRRLNQRLIPAILRYDNDFAHSIWWSLSAFAFDTPTGT